MPTTLLGVDGGGTRTRSVLLEVHEPPELREPLAATGPASGLRLRVLGRGEAASCNRYSVGPEAALRNLLSSAREALSSAGLDAAPALRDARIAWGLGLAGAISIRDVAEWRERLQPHLAPGSRLCIGEDALAAQSGAFAGGPGAILIAGTGANAFGRDAQGRTARADGLGPLLGDRGSGFWIGQEALRATARHHDGVAACPLLHREVLAFFEAPDAPALVPVVYAPGWTKDRAAALVPAVSRAAQLGDTHAFAILEAAGTELAHTAAAVLLQLQLQEVALLGGVLEHVPAVARAFELALRAAAPQARLVKPRHEASVGAALLALPEP